MTTTGSRGWLNGLARIFQGKGEKRPRRAPHRGLRLDRLEDRLAPAFGLLVNATGATSGVTATVSGTTTTFTATATSAHLNVNDIVTALNTGNVVVDSGATGTEAGNITINSGVTQPAANGAALTFQTGSGTGVVGNINVNANVNSAGSGDSFPLNFLALNNLVLNGNLDSGAGITLTATNGAVSQTSGQVTFASQLSLSASTGIGTVLDPIETQISNLEAVTSTGGIFITNGATSALTLNIVGAGTDSTPDGVITTTSGDIQLINHGGIDVVTNADLIRTKGTGNITVEALGSTADVQTGGQDGTFNVIRAAGSAGNVLVTAGEDILMGNASGLGSIVAAAGSTTVNAGRNLIIDSGSRLSVDGGSADVTATAGGNITLQQTNGSGANVSNSGSGNVSLTTGAGGVFTLDSGAGGSVTSTGGNITISADSMVINDPVSTGNTSAGIVTLKPFTSGRPIDLGHNPSVLPNELGLAQSDLNKVTAGVLRIGSSGAGSIAVTAAITDVGTGWTTLSLISGSTVSEAAGSVTVASLAVQAASLIGLGGSNAVSNVAAVSTASAFVFGDSLSLTVTTVDGVSGISTAAITLLESTVANTALTVSQPVTTNGGQDITFQFDNLTLGAGVTAAGHRVTLEPFSSGQLINLGGADAAGTLGLDSTDLGNVTASTLQVGDSTSGNITVSNAIALTKAATLDLETGGGVSETTAPSVGTVSVANLAVRAVNAVAMTNGNDVTTGSLAAVVTGASQSFSFTDANGLTIGTADGLSDVTTHGGNVTLTGGGTGALTSAVTPAITAGTGTVSLKAGSGGIGASGSPVVVSGANLDTATTGNGNQFLSASTSITIDATGLSAGTGTVEFDAGTFTLGGSDRVADSTKVNVNGATFAIGGFSETVATLTLTSGSVTGTTGVLTSTNTIQTVSGTVSAILAGANGLTQSAGGTTALMGVNIYTGPTTVSGGTLDVDSPGSTAAGSAVTVSGTGTLGGTGTIGGSVTVNSGGTLSPGDSPGKLTMASLAVNPGSTFTVEVNSPYATAGTDYDQANVTGNVTINGATFNLVGGAIAPTPPVLLTVIKTGGTTTVTSVFVTATSTPLPEGSIVSVGSFAAALSYKGGAGNDVTLAIAPDLTLTKTDNVNHATGVGSPWTWTLHVANTGLAPATFTVNQAVVRDNLPNSTIAYGGVSFGNFVGLSSTNLLGSISASDDLTVSASGGSVMIPVNGSFDITFTATASALGIYANPRAGAGMTAAVDPDNHVTELSKANNTASDSVIVSPTSVNLFFVQWGTSIAQVDPVSGGRLMPQGPTPRNNTIPWANINSFHVHLSQPTALAAGDVHVTGVAVANYGPVTITPLGGSDYTITLAQPINAADRVTVTIGNAGITAFSGELDVLPGDYNDDGVVSIGDDLAIRSKIGAGTLDTFADVNGDGAVAIGDVLLARSRIGTHLP